MISEIAREYADEEPDVLEPPEVWGVEALAASSVVLRLVVKTRPSEQWRISRELRERLKVGFDAAGIEIPFPQQTVWARSPEQVAAVADSRLAGSLERLPAGAGRARSSTSAAALGRLSQRSSSTSSLGSKAPPSASFHQIPADELLRGPCGRGRSSTPAPLPACSAGRSPPRPREAPPARSSHPSRACPSAATSRRSAAGGRRRRAARRRRVTTTPPAASTRSRPPRFEPRFRFATVALRAPLLRAWSRPASSGRRP